ncbi:MAG: hypothetical protein AAF433_10435 [Bacteroidota bacterium]
MKTPNSIIILVLLGALIGWPRSVSAQKDHYLGGQLNLDLTDIGINAPGVSTTNRQNNFGLDLSVQKLWEVADKQAFGLGLQWSAAIVRQSTSGQTSNARFGQFGLLGFWRMYWRKPAEKIRLWIQPQVMLGYGKRTMPSNNGQMTIVRRNYIASLGLGPGMLWQFAERWRLNVTFGGLVYSFNYATTDGQEGSSYQLNLNVLLNPATAFFGVEYRL